MKAMILAAGRGERLRPLTDTVPKPMVEVNKQPLIVYHIKRLAMMGITDIVINHAWLGDKLVTFLGDGQRYGVKIQYSAESAALETGGGIKQALPLLGSDPFLVLNGDVFIEGDLTLPQLAPNSLAHLWLVSNPPQHPQGDFALCGGQLQPSGDDCHTYSGMAIFHPDFFKDCADGAFPLAPLMRQHMQHGRVQGSLFEGFWCDVGTIERLDALNYRQQQNIVK